MQPMIWILGILTFGGLAAMLAGLAFGRHLTWRFGLIIAVIAACIWGLHPRINANDELETNLKLGLDLAGGTSLLYSVDVPENADTQDAINKTIDALKRRIDPEGVRNLTWREEAGSRIEVQMPRPSTEVQQRRAALDQIEQDIQARNITQANVDAAMALDGDAFDARVKELINGVPQRDQLFHQLKDAQVHLNNVTADLKTVANDPDKKEQLAGEVAKAQIEHEKLLEQLLNTNVSTLELRRVLNRPEKAAPGSPPETKSPRQVGIDQMLADHPARADQIKQFIAAYEAYQQNKGQLDDPNDLIRLLKGQGVLEFRITVNQEEAPNADELRRRLTERGPQSFVGQDKVFVKVDDPAMFAKTLEEREALRENPAAYFANHRGLIGAAYGDDYYILCWNTPDKSLTQRPEQTGWKVENVQATLDRNYMRAVAYSLNPIGSRLMGNMTGDNVHRQMAMILDGKILSAPEIREPLHGNVEITGGSGGFSQQEQQYLINTLDAGSLQARLSPEPISIRTVGPQLGADNLAKGMTSARDALILVCIFMIVYYFFAGLVADLALVANILIILGIMSMYQASFTLPGIAGIVLTIGMAVDANVLIYERIREELLRGVDMETALRLGYEKALSAIIDGNLTNLIVCVILYQTATVEVRGFAVTLGIGILATLFTALFMTRAIFTLWYRFFGFRRMNMLPLTFKAIDKILTPAIHWIRKAPIFMTISVLLIIGGVAMMIDRGKDMLDIEFRAGTEVAFEVPDAKAMPIQDVRDRIKELAATDPKLADLNDATVVSLGNPVENPDKYTGFSIASTIEDTNAISEAIKEKFGDVLDVKFRAGNEVTFKVSEANAMPIQMVRDRIKELAGANPKLAGLANATVAALGSPVPNPSKYKGFSIASTVEDATLVSDAIKEKFSDVLDIQPALKFDGEGDKNAPVDLVKPIINPNMSETLNVQVPVDQQQLQQYRGGVAVLVRNIDPAASVDDINRRIKAMRLQPDFEAFADRDIHVYAVPSSATGQVGQFTSMVIVVADQQISFLNTPDAWPQLASQTWNFVNAALTRDTSLSKVSNFTPTVARTLRDQAVVAVLLSLLAIIAYIWFRFGSLRHGIAATAALVHDTLISLGAIATAHFLAGTAIGNALLLGEFKINLGVIAAILTLIGYSLNDTIVVFDRIRENRGKLAVASEKIIDLSINQTVSRTILTAGTTLLAVIVLYVFGGAAIRSFAFALLIGVTVGTYSSIAIASPLLLMGNKLAHKLERNKKPANNEPAKTSA